MTISDFGKAVRHHGLEIGPDEFAIWLDARDDARPRAGRDDDVFGLISPRRPKRLWGRDLAAASLAFFDAAATTSPGFVIVASPQITSTLFFLSKKPTPAFNCAETVARALHDGGGIETDLAFDRQAIILGVIE